MSFPVALFPHPSRQKMRPTEGLSQPWHPSHSCLPEVHPLTLLGTGGPERQAAHLEEREPRPGPEGAGAGPRGHTQAWAVLDPSWQPRPAEADAQLGDLRQVLTSLNPRLEAATCSARVPPGQLAT